MVEERVQRTLAAILAADFVGYSRLMEQDETGTLARLKAISRTKATRIMTIDRMLQTVAGGGLKYQDFRGRRGFEERQVPENRRFVINCRWRQVAVCLRLMKPSSTRPRSDEPQEVRNRTGPSAFAR